MDEGVLYVAVGEEYVDEATRSAKTVREHMGDVEIAIATDSEEYDLDAFDHVIQKDESSQAQTGDRTWLGDTSLDPDLSPFEKTLYLDTDTYLCDDVNELFELLDRYELAIARHPEQKRVESLPEPWHIYNCGVIAYRDTPGVRQLLDNWARIYRHRVKIQDYPAEQPSFAEALYVSDIGWYTLSQRYNIRFTDYGRAGYITDDPKIVHGRDADPEVVVESLTRVDGPRTYRPRVQSPAIPAVQTGVVFRSESIARRLSQPAYETKQLICAFVRAVKRDGVSNALVSLGEFFKQRLPTGT